MKVDELVKQLDNLPHVRHMRPMLDELVALAEADGKTFGRWVVDIAIDSVKTAWQPPQQKPVEEPTLRAMAEEMFGSGCPFYGSRDPERTLEFISESGGIRDLKYSELTPGQKSFWRLTRQIYNQEKVR